MRRCLPAPAGEPAGQRPVMLELPYRPFIHEVLCHPQAVGPFTM